MIIHERLVDLAARTQTVGEELNDRDASADLPSDGKHFGDSAAKWTDCNECDYANCGHANQ